jgi:S-adenosylmethionine decarboxylase
MKVGNVGMSKIINTFEKEFISSACNTQLYNALILAAQKSGATLYQMGKHEFYPQGMSAFVILGESHVALHSFPEKTLVWVQLSTCSKQVNADIFFDFFSKEL